MALWGFTRIELQTYLILSFCWVSIVIVNMLEQPYARSLVVCDEPANNTMATEFSGSKHCGNRLHVIDAGTKITGKGQSLENVGRIIITFFISGFVDRGRRNAAILGQTLITASTVLFFLAGFAESWSIPLYVIAQGMQGMSGIGILDQIVTGDVALQLDDTVGVYKRKNTFISVLMFAVFPLVCYIQYAEFADFTWVWLTVVGMNISALLLLICFFPETMAPADQSTEIANKTSLVELCKQTLRTYWNLTVSHPLIRWRLLEEFFSRLANTSSIAIPFMMAVFSLSQLNALASVGLPSVALTPFFMPLIPYFFERYPCRMWNFCYWSSKFLQIMVCFFMTSTIFGIPVPIVGVFLMLPYSGYMTIVQAIEIRLVGAENNSKYQAMMQLVGFFCEAFTSYLYSLIFDAGAITYLGQCRPYLIATIPMILAVPVFLLGNGPLQLAECEKFAQEKRMEKMAEDSSAEKTDDTKKTN